MARISLVNNGASLQVNGLNQLVMNDIARDTATHIWESLIPVYRMPADTEMKSYQPVQPGSYRLKDSTVVFTPDTQFVNGQAYFVRYYHLAPAGLADYVKGRTRAGQLHFTDLIFKR